MAHAPGGPGGAPAPLHPVAPVDVIDRVQRWLGRFLVSLIVGIIITVVTLIMIQREFTYAVAATAGIVTTVIVYRLWFWR